jgi:hypothetical protein
MATVQRFTTPVFRMSFPKLAKPEAYQEGSKEKFSCGAIWTPANFTEKEKVLWRNINNAMNEAAKERFKKSIKELKVLNSEGASYKLGLRDGKSKADLEGYGEGTIFANLSSEMRPGIVDRNKNPISHEEGNMDEIYPGAYFRATVTVYSYDGKGKGVSLGLMNLQKVKDCADEDRLDSRRNAAEDFDDDFLEDEDTEGFLGDDDDIGF